MDVAAPHRCWLEGGPAIWTVQGILARPGIVAIDFESFPTAPSWHIEQAQAEVPRGQKGEAGKRAKLWAAVNGQAKRRQACTLQVRHEDGEEAFCRLLEPEIELPQMFGRVAEGVTLCAHNAIFETEVLLKHGIALDIECTLLAAKALYLTAVPPDQPQPQGFSLAALVLKEFERVRDKTIRDRDWRLEESLDGEALQYGLQDVRDAVELWQLYRQRLIAEGLWQGYEAIARAILPTAAINVFGGLVLDGKAHEKLIGHMRAQAYQLEHELDRICGEVIDIHSAPQVSEWIIGTVLQDGLAAADLDSHQRRERLSRFVIALIARTNGACKGWRMTEKTGCLEITRTSKLKKAEQLKDVFTRISEYLVVHERWRKAQKLLEAFGDALLRFRAEDGRVRGQMKLGGTVTLRHSCRDPNLQQQPNDPVFRALWIAPPGRKLAIADFSQIELRLLCIETRDERLMDVYRQGRDVHAETASIAYHVPLDQVTKEQRRAAKAINFGLAFGSGASGLAEHGGFTLDEARILMSRVLGAYPGLAQYRQDAPIKAASEGQIGIRPCRRILYDPAVSKGTQAINFRIQGGAASVQMRALRMVYDGLRARPELESFVAASVHDEFILESPDDARAEEAAKVMVDGMVQALIEIFPEAGEMGLSRLSSAKVVSSWAEKE